MTWTVVRIYLIYVHLLCFQVTREVQHNFSFLLKALSFKHEPEVFKMNSGFQDKSMTKECQMAVKTFVSRRKNRTGMLYPSSLDHSELFKVAGIMSSNNCVHS